MTLLFLLSLPRPPTRGSPPAGLAANGISALPLGKTPVSDEPDPLVG